VKTLAYIVLVLTISLSSCAAFVAEYEADQQATASE